jgi:uncharacterized membrane protein (UPF0127 family)
MGIIAEHWLADDRVQLTVQQARGPRRLTGLLLGGPQASGAALRFPRCRSVHGIGMRRAIDAVFVSPAGVVTSVRELRPWRTVSDRAASQVFELRAGEAARLGLVPGTHLRQANQTRGGAEVPSAR